MELYKTQSNNRFFEEFVEPRIAKYGKIFKTSLMGSPIVVVNGVEANRFILSNEFNEESKARDSKDVGGSSGRKEKRNGKQLARRGKRSATIAIGGCNDSRGYYGQEVIDNVVLLVFAANDTTSFAIAMAFKMLAQHPECYSLLLQGTVT
ncbi:hypothetical protein SCA6_013826 [Theobroma cacao]